MKRTQSDISRSRALTLQPHILAYHVHNIELTLKLIRKIQRGQSIRSPFSHSTQEPL